MTNLILLPDEVAAFQRMIWDFYREHKRSFAWRGISDPYRILVSEMMLQQTQTARVVPKYDEWMQRFPTVQALAEAPLSAVLACWSGLGYNRRAVFLQNACKAVCNEHGGVFPTTQKALQALPGIGSYTAGAVATFAYDQPNVFIETNIRSVYIHTFFAPDGAVAAAGGNNAANVDAVSQSADGIAAAAGIHGAVSAVDSALSAAGTLLQPAASTFPTSGKIDDKDIAALVEQTLDRTNPREWYYALMDYGAMLKKQTVNPSRRSRQYAKQSRFEGSFRQARGAILRQLSQRQHATLAEIALHEHIDLARLSSAAEKLVAEKLVTACDGVYRIAD